MNKKNSLDDVLNAINKAGKDLNVGTADSSSSTNIDFVSIGCQRLDDILGGGIPSGRIIEIFGESGQGKSTLALFIIAQFQKLGKRAAFVDAEFSFASDYAVDIGVNLSELIFTTPSSGESAFTAIRSMIETGVVDLIVVDSSAALVPEKEMDSDFYGQSVALSARMISRGLRVITGIAAQNKTTVIFISQVRSKVGMMSFGGVTTEATGGKALKFYSSIRLKVRTVKKLKKGEQVIGNKLAIIAEKNKVGAPFKKAEIDLIFSKGIDIDGMRFDTAVERNIVVKKGNTYYFKDEKLGVGREAAIEYILANDKKLFNKIMKDVDKGLDKK